MGIMELSDGSKNIIFADSKDEALKVFQAMKAITIPDYVIDVILESIEKNTIKWGEVELSTNGEPMKVVNVEPIYAEFFSMGRLNRTYKVRPDWRVRFDQANLF